MISDACSTAAPLTGSPRSARSSDTTPGTPEGQYRARTALRYGTDRLLGLPSGLARSQLGVGRGELGSTSPATAAVSSGPSSHQVVDLRQLYDCEHMRRRRTGCSLCWWSITARLRCQARRGGSRAPRKQQVAYAAYTALNKMENLTPGPPLGLQVSATTFRVENGSTVTTQGPYLGVENAVGGFYVAEAEDLAAAVAIASRIPQARRAVRSRCGPPPGTGDPLTPSCRGGGGCCAG